MPRPIAILTDFGSKDVYVGIMKGVLLARCPDARIFDLTHEVPPQDILAGALLLRSAVPYCPEDTVFLAVVDPGVGGARRPICLRSGTRLFVGPDNGLLLPAASLTDAPDLFHLDRPEVWLPELSTTFHGRDLFAPVAAALAAGATPEAVGTSADAPASLQIPEPHVGPGRLTGEVIYIDHFGNAITNLRPEHLGSRGPAELEITAAGTTIRGPVKSYGDGAPERPIMVLGSWGYFEVAMNGDSAALLLGLQRGSVVIVSLPATTPAA